MNKKGDLPSILISLIVILFVIGFISIVFSKIFLDALGELKEQPEFSNNTIDTITSVEEKTIPFLDYLFFFSFIAISIGLIISSVYIDTHPAIAIIFIISLIIAVVIGGIFANAFVEIGEQSELATTYNSFTLTKVLINHFPLLIFIIGLIVTIILFSKRGGSSAPV